MRRAAAIAVLMYLIPHSAHADARINFRFDFNKTTVKGAYNGVGFDWQGLEFEFDKEFRPSRVLLSGFAFGVRRELFYAFTGFGGVKDVDRWDEGTYLTLRLYRSFEVSSNRSWGIGPSFSILYGVPGTTLDRTVANRYGEGFDYTHVFPLRNTDLPRLITEEADLVANAGLFYPEISVAVRKRLAKGGLNLEWIFGVRVIRFGIVDSNARGDVSAEKQKLIPTIGMRVGFKIS
jgi:hypothetical protein